MAKKKQINKKHSFSFKRYFATCTKCGMRYENDEYDSTLKKCCICKMLLTWNDSKELKTVEGVR